MAEKEPQSDKGAIEYHVKGEIDRLERIRMTEGSKPWAFELGRSFANQLALQSLPADLNRVALRTIHVLMGKVQEILEQEPDLLIYVARGRKEGLYHIQVPQSNDPTQQKPRKT